MLNYKTSIKGDIAYSDLEIKEIKPIMKLIIRGKTKEFIFIPMENKNINVTIVNPVFFDKENERLNA